MRARKYLREAAGELLASKKRLVCDILLGTLPNVRLA